MGLISWFLHDDFTVNGNSLNGNPANGTSSNSLSVNGSVSVDDVGSAMIANCILLCSSGSSASPVWTDGLPVSVLLLTQ